MTEHTNMRCELTDTYSNGVYDVVRIGTLDIRVGDIQVAERIANCIDACAGIDTDTICKGVVPADVVARLVEAATRYRIASASYGGAASHVKRELEAALRDARQAMGEQA